MINPKDIDLTTLPWIPLDATAGFPEKPGIYFAVDSQDKIQYIGRSCNIRGRWKNHHRYNDLKAIGQVRIVYLFVEESNFLADIENALIQWFDPPLNVVRVNQETVKSSKSRKISTVKIAKLRESVGLTQRELADKVGVTDTTIRNYEKGRSVLDWIERVIRLCDALECNPRDFI